MRHEFNLWQLQFAEPWERLALVQCPHQWDSGQECNRFLPKRLGDSELHGWQDLHVPDPEWTNQIQFNLHRWDQLVRRNAVEYHAALRRGRPDIPAGLRDPMAVGFCKLSIRLLDWRL
jgi:hypothetical protein